MSLVEDENDPIPTKMGRPQSVVREHFVKKSINGVTKNICQYCKKHVSDQAHRMKSHLQKCLRKHSPRSNMNDFFQDTPSTAIPVSSIDVTTSTAVPVSSIDVPKSAQESKKKNQEGLRQPKITGHLIKWDTKTQEEASLRMGRFIFSANLPFHVAENPEFKSFINFLNASFKIPSHDTIGGTIVDKVYKEISEERKDILKEKKVVLLQDGWSTNQKDPVIGHCIFTPEATHFFSAENVGGETKGAEFCFKLFEKAMAQSQEDLNVEVIGLVTDNCNTMLALHELVKTKYPHMHAYGCNPHLMNLVGKYYLPEETQEKVQFVHKYFRNHDKARAFLKEKGGGRPILPNSTRWNSQIDSFKNFCKNQHLYLEISRQLEAHNSKDKEKLDQLNKILNDPDVYPKVKRTFEILEPISIQLDQVSPVFDSGTQLYGTLVQKLFFNVGSKRKCKSRGCYKFMDNFRRRANPPHYFR